MSSHFEQNRAFFHNLRVNQEYTDLVIMLTGYIDPATGVLVADPCYGLEAGYIWLHSEYGRMNTRAIIGQVRSDLAGARVVSGLNQQGERVAIRPVFDQENVNIWGLNLPGLALPTIPGQSSNTPLPSRLLMGGRVLQATASPPGLNVFVESYPQAGLTSDDPTHSLSADVPATTGFCWDVLFIDTDGVVYSSPTAIDATAFVKENLALADAYALPLPAGVRRLAAVSLYYGQTDILYTSSRFEDMRDFIDVQDDAGEWVVDYPACVPSGLQMGVERGIRIVGGGSLIINGSVYIV